MPSSMFSYLRPGYAKRHASSATSTEPVASPAVASAPSSNDDYPEYFAPDRRTDQRTAVSSSSVSPHPPKLPPIVRVVSKFNKPSPSENVHSVGNRALEQVDDQNRRNRGDEFAGRRKEEQFSLESEPNCSTTRPKTAGDLVGQRLPAFGVLPRSDHGKPSNSSTHLSPSIGSANYSSFSKSQTSLMSGLSDKLSGNNRSAAASTAPHTKTKSRLNLRNQMSLLMRRRSSQALDSLSDDSPVTQRTSPVPPMPDNYDPSIRGHIVHDFNAPRVNRNFSYSNANGEKQAAAEIGRVSPTKADRAHTPVFREHFDDDTSYEQSQAAIRAEQLANKDFLTRNTPQILHSEPSSLLPPPKDPAPQPQEAAEPAAPVVMQLQSDNGIFDHRTTLLSSTILSPVLESPNNINAIANFPSGGRKSTKMPPTTRSRATSIHDPSFQSSGIPTYSSSRASRFSFQIPGVSDSTQEKELEDRHKAKAAEKALETRLSNGSIEDELAGYEMDDYDMGGDYDEEIPMLGEEDDYGGGLGDQSLDDDHGGFASGGLGHQSLDSDLGTYDEEVPMLGEEEDHAGLNDQSLDNEMDGLDFSPLSSRSPMSSPLSPMSVIAPLQTPIDLGSNRSGFATPEEKADDSKLVVPNFHNEAYIATPRTLSQANIFDKIGSPDQIAQFKPIERPPLAITSQKPVIIELNDDMYFDDGMIGDQENVDSTEFDENVFDDPNGPLFERKVKFANPEEMTGDVELHGNTSQYMENPIPSLAPKTSIVSRSVLPDFNNIEAYHGALADAANRAEAAGRFTRKQSVGSVEVKFKSDLNDISSSSDSQFGPNSNYGQPGLEADDFQPYEDAFGMNASFVDDYGYDDFDLTLEDDPIIAAANAEALAYDDDGFYGTEFGFYASAVGESPGAWGGYFGPSGLGRSVSGRNAVREPNLTPITERSEYSTRNSLISLHHYRDGQQPLSSPALAQLARMSPYGWFEEEDMSLDSLLKLRKGAFGGSGSSLPGSISNSPRNSSPIGIQFAQRMSSPVGNRMKEHNENGVKSNTSTDVGNKFRNTEQDDDDDLADAVNVAYSKDKDRYKDVEHDYARRSAVIMQDSDPLGISMPSSPAEEASTRSPILELISQHNTRTPSHSPQASLSNHFAKIASQGTLGSPFTPQHRYSASPPLDTSATSPSTAGTNSHAPRRQSLGVVSSASSSPLTPNGTTWRSGHSRKGSAADSVTYVREHDEAGEGRWILERRRTAESGELELIGREIVEGGRI